MLFFVICELRHFIGEAVDHLGTEHGMRHHDIPELIVGVQVGFWHFKLTILVSVGETAVETADSALEVFEVGGEVASDEFQNVGFVAL